MLGDSIDVVAFDEIQFFPAETRFFEVTNYLLTLGYDVLAAGLDLDFAGRPFGSTPQLWTLVGGTPNDKTLKLDAYCKQCGGSLDCRNVS